MASNSRPCAAGITCLLALLLTMVLLPGFIANAGAATATASIYVTILPPKDMLKKPLRVTPESLSLKKNGYGKLTVANHSGQSRSVRVDVTPGSFDGCRLSYTPKYVVLEDGQAQVFRLFYTTQDNSDCRAVFQLNIQYDNGIHKLVKVDCM